MLDLSPAPEGERGFNPWLRAKTPEMHQLVNDAVAHALEQETTLGLRKRRRSANAQLRFNRTVECVVCNLLTAHPTPVHVSRSKQYWDHPSRYRPHEFGWVVPDALDLLAHPAVGLIHQAIGDDEKTQAARQTIIAPTVPLVRSGMSVITGNGHVRRTDDEEVIFLKDTKEYHSDCPKFIDYTDTPATVAMRDTLRGLNRYIEGADISVYDRGIQCWTQMPVEDRRMVRIFHAGRFNFGGRLYHANWIDMKKEDRRRHLRIDGGPVAEIDYSQAALRIAYGEVGVDPGDGDLYVIPPFEGCRAGVKKVFTSMIGSSKALERFPKETRGLFPKSATFADVQDAIIARHKPIEPLLCQGWWGTAFLRESEIIIDVLTRLRCQGIVGLPVHDCVVAPLEHVGVVERIMLETFRDHIGVPGKVSVLRE